MKQEVYMGGEKPKKRRNNPSLKSLLKQLFTLKRRKK